MSKIIGKYKFEDVTEGFETPHDFGWKYLLPSIEYRHKYWYLWEFEFMFWKWSKRIEISRTDWNQHKEKDEKWTWDGLKKILKSAS